MEEREGRCLTLLNAVGRCGGGGSTPLIGVGAYIRVTVSYCFC